MDKVERLAPDLWRIELPLPFRLRSIALFLVRGEEGYALVDSGIDTDASRDAFDAALSAIGARRSDIRDVYVTHMHPDHIGMAGRHAAAGARVHIMRGEERRARYVWSERPLDAWIAFLKSHGSTGESAASITEAATRLRSLVTLPESFAYVEDGDVVRLGDRRARVVWTPGHSDYHYVLVDDDSKAIFSGDHLLPTITPNIGLYPECRPDPLAEYLASFSRFSDIAGYTVLPGHGEPYSGLAKRIDELQAHHRQRLQGVWDRAADAEERGASSADIVGHFWGDRLSAHETRFALVEIAAHLEHLRLRGDLEASTSDGVIRYKQV
jgi:glyoxylase-like metal-dependent hydrolase (beta-lactamase superfamily II)